MFNEIMLIKSLIYDNHLVYDNHLILAKCLGK